MYQFSTKINTIIKDKNCDSQNKLKMVTHKSWRCQEKVSSFPNQVVVARKQEPVLWNIRIYQR